MSAKNVNNIPVVSLTNKKHLRRKSKGGAQEKGVLQAAGKVLSSKEPSYTVGGRSSPDRQDQYTNGSLSRDVSKHGDSFRHGDSFLALLNSPEDITLPALDSREM